MIDSIRSRRTKIKYFTNSTKKLHIINMSQWLRLWLYFLDCLRNTKFLDSFCVINAVPYCYIGGCININEQFKTVFNCLFLVRYSTSFLRQDELTFTLFKIKKTMNVIYLNSDKNSNKYSNCHVKKHMKIINLNIAVICCKFEKKILIFSVQKNLLLLVFFLA